MKAKCDKAALSKPAKDVPKRSNATKTPTKVRSDKAALSKAPVKENTSSVDDSSKKKPLPLLVLTPVDPELPQVPPRTSTYLAVGSKTAALFNQADETVDIALEIAAQSHTNPESTYSKLEIFDDNVGTCMIAAVQRRIILAPQCGFDLSDLPFPEPPDLNSIAQDNSLPSWQSLSRSNKHGKLPIRDSGDKNNKDALKLDSSRTDPKTKKSSAASRASSSSVAKKSLSQTAPKKVPASGVPGCSDRQRGKALLKPESNGAWTSKSGLIEKPNWPPGQDSRFNDIQASKTSVRGLVGGASKLS